MPVFIKQQRIGKHRAPFQIIKFRTMKKGSEKMPDFVDKYSGIDPRITKIGWVLRRTGLDELPQVSNIIKGEMALVGPRPLMQRDWDLLDKDKSEDWPRLLEVKPGLIGCGYTKLSKNFFEARKIELDWVKKFEKGESFLLEFRTAIKVMYNIASGKVKNP